MTTRVHAPLTGQVVEIAQVPDPVFAQSLVGPGIAISPTVDVAALARAPVAGTLSTLRPHAFIVTTPEGIGVLVHLGINTVELGESAAELLATEGSHVGVGEPVSRWHPADVRSGGRDSLTPVIALDVAPERLTFTRSPGGYVLAGEDIFIIRTEFEETA